MTNEQWEELFESVFREGIRDEAELIPMHEQPSALIIREKYDIAVKALHEICSNDPNRLSNMGWLAEEALKEMGESE